MTDRDPSRRTAAPAARLADPPLPHPSWRLMPAGHAPADRTDRIVDAEDFWRRLGI